MSEQTIPPVSPLRPYHEALADGRLAITRCADCARWQWYPLMACPQCHSQQWVWEDVEMGGILHSWTRVHRPTVVRAGLEPPYLIGIIELPQAGGARVLALSDAVAVDPAVGDGVRLLTTRLGEDTLLQFGASS